VDTPVPEKGRGGGAEQAAGGNSEPDMPAESADRRKPVAEKNPGKEHGGAGQQGPRSNGHGRASERHEPLVEQNPAQSNDERGDDEEVAADVAASNSAVAGTEDDEGDAGGGGEQGEPSLEVEALVREEVRADGEDDGHGADHERGVADGGEPEPFKLHDELDRDTEEGADEEEFPLAGRETRSFDDGEHTEAGEDEAVEHVVVDAEAGEGDFAKEEPGAPAASGKRAGEVADGAAPVSRLDGGVEFRV